MWQALKRFWKYLGAAFGAKVEEKADPKIQIEQAIEESNMKDLKGMHDQAMEAAERARQAVETNALNLQKQLAERSKLLSQLENAKMQERLNDALKQMDELSPKADVPTLAQVRDKIET